MRKRKIVKTVGPIAVLLAAGAGAGGLAFPHLLAAQTLSVQEIVRPEPTDKVTAETRALFKSSVSDKNLLHLERETPFGLPKLTGRATQVDTVHVLAIRVEFQFENPDDSTTTGRGLFDRSAPGQSLIDPPPHGRLYFQAHLRALANYWRAVSNGKLEIVGDVFPTAELQAYQLPVTMAYYGSKGPWKDSSITAQLGHFFYDAVLLADTQEPAIDFSRYDALILFHAGADRQNDLGDLVAYTPNDLFTGFIVLDTSLSPRVDNDSVRITGGIIAPESPSQDNRVVALNGVLAHEFGHVLGLPDLYNTTSRPPITQLGDFSLMDNFGQDVGVVASDGIRTVTAFGLVPTYLDAWSRAFLGFLDTLAEIRNGQNLQLAAAALQQTGIEAVKVPISSREYFLLENRQEDIDGITTNIIVDSVTNVVLGTGYRPPGQPRQFSDEYDILLPGSGIAVYHVDEGVAYLLDPDFPQFTKFETNSVQTDPNRRMVALEEADGYVDFGGNYFTGFGTSTDLYRAGNNTAFTPTSNPSTRTNFKANSHISITNISASSPFMTLDVKTDFTAPGWPVWAGKDTGTVPVVIDTTAGRPLIFTRHGQYVLGWEKTGQPIFSNAFSDTVRNLNNSTSVHPLAVFARAAAPLSAGPSVADINGDGAVDVVAVGTDRKLYVWTNRDANIDGLADSLPGFPVSLVDTVLLAPVCLNDSTIPFLPNARILVGGKNERFDAFSAGGTSVAVGSLGAAIEGISVDETGKIYLQLRRPEGVTLTEFPNIWLRMITSGTQATAGVWGPVTGDLNRDGVPDIVLVDQSGLVHAFDSAGVYLPGFPVRFSQPFVAEPILADFDGDGYLDIVGVTQNKIAVFNRAGVMVTDFPVGPEVHDLAGYLPQPPVFLPVDNSNVGMFLASTRNGNLNAFHQTNLAPATFPLSIGSQARSTIAAVERLGRTQLFLKGSDGFLYSFLLDAGSQPLATAWPQFGYNAGHTHSFPSNLLPPVARPAGPLVRKESFFPYPNPAQRATKLRYYLTEDADVTFSFFDLAGNLVEEKRVRGGGSRDNDFDWDCSTMAAGVYLCRMEAKSAGQKQVEFTKIAVVR